MTSVSTSEVRPSTRLAFHASRIIIDIGVLLVLGAMSLPFVAAEGFRQQAMAADALPALLLVLPVFVVTLLPDHTRPLPPAFAWASLGLAATALPYALVKYLDASTVAGTVRGSVGMGARLLVLGAFVTLAGIVLGLIRNWLGLPAAGSYPARRSTAPAPSSAPAKPVTPPAGRSSPSRTPPATRSSPSRTPPGTRQPGQAAVPTSARPAPQPAPRRNQPAPPAQAPPTVPGARPAGTRAQPSGVSPTRPSPPPPAPPDPDDQPTLPGNKPVRDWWPDDLEDLFS